MADGSLGRGRPASAQEILRAIRLVTSALRFDLEVPGNHPSGIAYMDLLAILDAQGRPFLKNTRSLREHAARTLRLTYDGATTLPTVREMESVAALAILDWIVRRRFGGNPDVRMTALTQPYLKAKHRAGFGTTIGVRTGALRDAVASARVEIL